MFQLGACNNLGTSGSGLNGKISNVGLLVTVQLTGEHPKRWVYFTHVWCWFLETQVDISTTCHVSHRPWTTVDLQWSERRSCTSVKMAVISHAVSQIIALAGMEKNNFDCLLKVHKVFSSSYNHWIYHDITVNIADILHSLPWEYCRIHFSKAQWSSRSQEESHHWDPSFQQHLTATYTHPSKQLQALFRTLQERCRTVHPRVGNSAIRGSDVKCKNFMDDFLMKHPLPCPILRAENKVVSSRDTYSVRVWSAQQHVSPGILNGLGDVLVCCAGNAGQYHYRGTLAEDDKDPNALIQY